MQPFNFSQYKKSSIARFKEIIDSHAPGACDEQGLPSYTNPNPLMRWLVWKRVQIVINAIENSAPHNRVLDYGCGYGVFLPYLNDHAGEIFAYDLVMEEIEKTCRAYQWENVRFVSDFREIEALPGSFDLILAIEVLEHVEDLERSAELFSGLLAPGGRMLIAGPTENFLYKIGRKLAGYSGEYHKRNIGHICRALEKKFSLRRIATLLPGLPFFEVYECRGK